MKIFLVAGARPNFMKIAPLYRESLNRNVECKIVHTGQHYDYEMSQAFFEDLELPKPDHFLNAGSGTHAQQTSRIMVSFEKLCMEEIPDMVVVVGDVNSTLACSIVAKKLGIKVAHVEAGLRSGDMTMPEEINRIVTDSISDYFFVTEKSAVDNLLREGKSQNKIFFVGHVMVDNLLYQLRRIETDGFEAPELQELKDRFTEYGFLTLHRPANVDQKDTLAEIVDALNEIADSLPLLFPVHPRTNNMLKQHKICLSPKIVKLSPLPFRQALFLWKDACVVLTDSGGLQEETTALGVPCITLRENTERPVTLELGTNILAGCKKENILRAFRSHVNSRKEYSIPPKWDGRASKRIWDHLSDICVEKF